MRIAIVGATGRIGAKLTRQLLDAGHQVRALSRGGAALDALAADGAEPFLGSFDTGTGELGRFFADIDAAFLMVKTDWGNIHGHYSDVALRFFDALRGSPVKLAVSLTGMGSDVRGSTGHFQSFYQLDQILNRLTAIDLVHLQAGWFMENLFAWIDSIAEYDRIAWSLDPDAVAPWVAIDDIATLAARELTAPDGAHRATRELGADYTMPQIAAIIGRALGRPISYHVVDRSRADLQTAYLARFGDLEKWLDESQTLAAINDRRVRFGDDRATLPTSMESFVATRFEPRFMEAIAAGGSGAPESFTTWSARPCVADGAPA